MAFFHSDKRFLTLFIIIFVHLVGFGIILPLLPLYAQSLGASPLTIGFLFASFSFFQFFFAPILGELSDKIGRRPVLLFSMLGTFLSFILLGVANSIPLLFIARSIDGISGGSISTAQAYIADITSKKNRTYGMGILTAAFGLGLVFGPSIGGVLSQFGYHVPALFSAGLSFIAFLLTYFFLPETIDKKKVTSKKRKKLFDIADFKDTLSRPTVGAIILVSFAFWLAFAFFHGTFSLFASNLLKLEIVQIGYLFAYIGVISALTQIFLLKRLIRYFGEKVLAVSGLLVMAVAFFIIPFTQNIIGLIVSLSLLSYGNSTTNPVLTGLVSKMTPKEEQGNIMGVFQSVASLGRLFGPIFGTLLYEISVVAPYYVSALILVAGTYAIYTILKKVKVAD